MFIPLLQLTEGEQSSSPKETGSAANITDFFDLLGIELTLTVALTFLSLFFLLKGLALFGGNSYRVIVQQFFVKTIRIKMLLSLSKLTYKKFTLTDVGRIQNTMSGEVARLSSALNYYLTAIQNGVLVLVYIALAIITNPKFSILVVIGGLLSNFLYQKIYSNTKKTSKQLTKESHLYQGLLIQYVANFKYLKATGTIRSYSKKLKKQIIQIEKNNRKLGMLSSLVSSVREPSIVIVVAIAILIQVKLFESSIGAILVSLLFFFRALSSLMTLQAKWNSFLGVSGSMDNMTEFQTELSNNKEQFGSKPKYGFEDSIVLEGLYFYYNNNCVLENINIEILKNETVAIVGESGSGKTTLVNVIAGLLHASKGNMTVDGEDIQNIDLSTFQSKIGYITQDPVIFNASIYDNVTFWTHPNQENLQKFEAALKKASLHDFVYNLPESFNTELGSNGINLSGGQKQRIAIARELFKDLDILIMDEATSALDSETERYIQNNINQLKGNCTILIVAHRLSTVKNADRIVLMDNKKIINIASYENLVQESTAFQQMVKLQELQN